MDIPELTTESLAQFVADNPHTMICYYSPKCVNCKLIFYYFYHLSQEFPTIQFRKYNIDNNPEFQQNEKINMLPCIFAYNSGRIACRYFGTTEATIRDIIAKYYPQP